MRSVNLHLCRERHVRCDFWSGTVQVCVCIAVYVQMLGLWAVFPPIGGLQSVCLLSQQGLVLPRRLCPSHDEAAVSLPVFTVQFVFRVQLGWDTETGLI